MASPSRYRKEFLDGGVRRASDGERPIAHRSGIWGLECEPRSLQVSSGDVNPGDHLTAVFNGAVTPPAAGSYQVQVSTSSDPATVASNSYTVVANHPVSNVTVQVSDPNPGASTTYTIGFAASATGGMSAAVSSYVTIRRGI